MKQTKHPEVHPLTELLERERTNISGFAKHHPDIWKVIGTGLGVSRMLLMAIGGLPNLSLLEVRRLTLWQSVLRYQAQSLILLLAHDMDSGYAILRMAAELSRDIYCIGDDQAVLDLWLDREHKRREYQTLFRFDDTLLASSIVGGIYRLCSQFGVHGHRTTSMFSEPVGFADKAGKLLLLDMPDSTVLHAVHMWLAGFSPMQHLCSDAFIKNHLIELQEESSVFVATNLLIADVVTSLDKALKKLAVDKMAERQ